MKAWPLVVLCTLAATACDRPAAPPKPAAPATTPAAAPATQAAAPRKAIFFVDDQPITFPPAKMVFEPRDGDMRVVLLSNDPPAAVRDKYVGNSFYFDLLLEKTTAADMDGATFTWSESGDAPGATERADTSTGLFLDNGRQTVLPKQAKISFAKDGDHWAVRVAGTFDVFDAHLPDTKPQTVAVNAVLEPAIAMKQ